MLSVKVSLCAIIFLCISIYEVHSRENENDQGIETRAFLEKFRKTLPKSIGTVDKKAADKTKLAKLYDSLVTLPISEEEDDKDKSELARLLSYLIPKKEDDDNENKKGVLSEITDYLKNLTKSSSKKNGTGKTVLDAKTRRFKYENVGDYHPRYSHNEEDVEDYDYEIEPRYYDNEREKFPNPPPYVNRKIRTQLIRPESRRRGQKVRTFVETETSENTAGTDEKSEPSPDPKIPDPPLNDPNDTNTEDNGLNKTDCNCDTNNCQDNCCKQVPEIKINLSFKNDDELDDLINFNNNQSEMYSILLNKNESEVNFTQGNINTRSAPDGLTDNENSPKTETNHKQENNNTEESEKNKQDTKGAENIPENTDEENFEYTSENENTSENPPDESQSKDLVLHWIIKDDKGNEIVKDGIINLEDLENNEVLQKFVNNITSATNEKSPVNRRSGKQLNDNKSMSKNSKSKGTGGNNSSKGQGENNNNEDTQEDKNKEKIEEAVGNQLEATLNNLKTEQATRKSGQSETDQQYNEQIKRIMAKALENLEKMTGNLWKPEAPDVKFLRLKPVIPKIVKKQWKKTKGKTKRDGIAGGKYLSYTGPPTGFQMKDGARSMHKESSYK